MRRSALSVVALAAVCLSSLAATSPTAFHGQSPPVTPVEGPSNFHRLGIAFESSDMGQTGVWGPPPEAYTGPPVDYIGTIKPAMVLSGADVYRLSCQACHKAHGKGTPPEIPAVIGPVQATSATFMERRMRALGRPVPESFARGLASGSKRDLLNRLKNGGQKMPPFGYLSDLEVNALISYLEVLAAVPGSGKIATVNEPAARVGELLVRGTCHICHDATDTWPSPEELLQGSIPPISGFTSKKTLPQFIWKVRHGAPVIMGSLQLPYRGRMPVFDYLSDDEVASAYFYLISDPPRGERAGSR